MVTNCFKRCASCSATGNGCSVTALTFHAANFSHDNGDAVIFLFREGDAIPVSPFKKLKGKIENGKATIIFKNISYGDYAAILLHDENSNGIIDHSFGIPCEPLGYTNNWRLTLISGMPTFEKLKFNFSKQNTEQTIAISFIQ